MKLVHGTIAAVPVLATAAVAQAAPVLEPATQKFIDGLAAAKAPPIYTLSPDDARNVLHAAQSGAVAKPAADIPSRLLPDLDPAGRQVRQVEFGVEQVAHVGHRLAAAHHDDAVFRLGERRGLHSDHHVGAQPGVRCRHCRSNPMARPRANATVMMLKV